MTRLTEYHNGVAVIKNKNFKAAAEKLAKYEDWEERQQRNNYATSREEHLKRIRKMFE